MNYMSAQSAVLLLQMLSSLMTYLLTMHPSEVRFTFLCSAEPVLHAFLALKPESSGITKSDKFQIISGSNCTCWNSSSKYLKHSNVLQGLMFRTCWSFLLPNKILFEHLLFNILQILFFMPKYFKYSTHRSLTPSLLHTIIVSKSIFVCTVNGADLIINIFYH